MAGIQQQLQWVPMFTLIMLPSAYLPLEANIIKPLQVTGAVLQTLQLQ